MSYFPMATIALIVWSRLDIDLRKSPFGLKYFIDFSKHKNTHILTQSIFVGMHEGCITTLILWDISLSHKRKHVSTDPKITESAERFALKSVIGKKKQKKPKHMNVLDIGSNAMIFIRLCTVWYVWLRMQAEYYCWVKTCFFFGIGSNIRQLSMN